MTELLERPTSTPDPLDPNTEGFSDNLSESPLYDGLQAETTATDEVGELEDMFSAESADSTTLETVEQNQEVPITATSRVGRILQRLADRLENGADRADTLSDKTEVAKTKIRGLGRTALSRLKTAGTIGLGLGINGAAATGRAVKSGAESTATAAVKGVNTFSEKVGDGMMAAGQKLDQGMDVVGNKIDSKVSSVKEAVSDYRAVREQVANRKAESAATAEYTRHAERMQRKNAALARKQARHDKWSNRRESVKQYGRDVKEGFVDTKEAAKYLTAAQKRKLGEIAARAKASGEAAIDSWKSYPER